ncbi:thyroid adenoma-associated protein homolog [Ananas comosus]|uniref:Thyroid adenoma-associated protein n=1 Tax=Ananas comosus TaxID=4615 RepID=A0A199W9J6_ANACO|nr:thyroid adenoma-associated protein homolog [Ananas comosus]OAY85901.1 Thyroid adenoma-associated protein [Ananas comosus]
MSGKWRALQHRHRYTYTSVVFPKSFFESLDLVPPEIFSSIDFFPQLKHLISLNSTYSQISEVKNLSFAFSRLLSSPEMSDHVVTTATRLYLEILFLENSLPLHRTLISALTKSRKFLPMIGGCFAALCEEYGNPNKKGKKRFLVSRAALSLIGYPKLGFLNEAVERCSNIIAMDVATGLEGVLLDIQRGSRPSPVVMEQCQEAMSCLYYLLQRYPFKFLGLEEDSNVFKRVIRTILGVLKSSAFSRDCLVASGVGFCAAIQVFMSPIELSLFISRVFFGFCSQNEEIVDLSVKKILPDSDLSSEIADFSVLSRLCLLRGILTAIPRSVLNMQQVHSTSGSSWTMLYSGILPELCNYCENPVDSHFNFHALTVTQICLQQIKTSILADLGDFSGDCNLISEEVIGRIVRIIWNNLEDPLSQTVKQVHLIFDLLLDIISSLPLAKDNNGSKPFLYKIAGDLLVLGPRCKGRYVPLASLTRRLGAKSLLNLNANLLFETVYSYIDDDVCCAATSFLKCFLECLRNECWSDDGVDKGYESFRVLCLPPLMQGLVSGHSKLRSNLNTYALPAVIETDSDSIFSMLAFISVGPGTGESKFNADLKTDQCIAALVSLLKVSRTLALLEGDIDLDSDPSSQTLSQKKDAEKFAALSIKGINVRVLVKWFVLALTHSDESLRIDAAESLFLNPKTSSLPSSFELRLVKAAVPLNMRCSSTAFQMKWTSLFKKFFSRVRTALERQVKQGLWLPFAGIGVKNCGDYARNGEVSRAEDLFQFVRWLSCFLFQSCYPSAPYERKTMAMELILIMLDVWPIKLPRGNHGLNPYTEVITSPDSTLSLAGSIVDSWDRLRENSFRILSCFHTPLPGISSNNSVNDLIRWAKTLVCSPRVRESDAGALTLRLVFKKYVVELGCLVDNSGNIDLLKTSQAENGYPQVSKYGNHIVQYISSLVEWLRAVVEEGERDLSEACRKSFVHGVLLTLRYTFEELDWNSEVLSSSSDLRRLLEELLELIVRITSLALWVVSADAWYMPYDMDDMVDDTAFSPDELIEEDQTESEPLDKNLKSEDNARPAEHVVMVGCWLAMKEVSLLFGTIIRKVPLPSCTISNSSTDDCSLNNVDESAIHTELLDLVQLETMGNHFLQVLLKMKHNGAIDKTRAGFTALCNRLLCSNDSRLCKMTELWLEQLMDRTIAKGQTVDDLLRRSAGIPAAFIALFLAEPEGTPKKLLPRALEWLIGIAKRSLSPINEGNNQKAEVENALISKIRDEGVVPTVHAFNVLRAAFNDTNLAADTSGFSAEAMILSIQSFSSPYWEIRNGACLAYTALVRRMIGFFNVQKRESARRSLTGVEFFHRYPALHPFIFDELKITTKLLDDGISSNIESNIAKAIRPSLCPILILLSRLKPSPISSGTDGALDPFLLVPFIQKCATQSNLRIRVLASRALTGLVSNEKLQYVINEVGHSLPVGKHHLVSFNSIHGLLLQLSSLLDGNLRNLTDVIKKDQILGELIHVLSDCLWLGSTTSCPCPTLNSSFIRVLDLMLDVARMGASRHAVVIQTLLFELTSQCLNGENSCELTFHDPTKIELQKQAALSYFSCLLGGNSEATAEDIQLQRFNLQCSKLSEMPEVEMSVTELHERIASCISNSAYEVRAATMKSLLKLAKTMRPGEGEGAMHQWARRNLLSVLMNHLFVEENPKCVYYILKAIFSWSTKLGEPVNRGGNFELVFHFWDRLVHLNSIMTQSKTREVIIRCMALCVKQLVKLVRSSIFINQSQQEETATVCGKANQSARSVVAIETINSFIKLVKGHSAPSEPVNMRRAAAEAIIASGLLEEAAYAASFVSNNQIPLESDDCDIEEKCTKATEEEITNLYAYMILDVWFTCIQLLEDEDVVLRQRLAKDVQKCIIISSGSSNNDLCSDAVPTQVDRVIELSFDFLASVFGHWLEYLSYLSRWVIDTAGSLESRGDLVRQIFDKEIDNHHEEKLLICQICCSHLQKLSVSNYRAARDHPKMEAIFLNWRQKFLQQLMSIASSFLENDGRTEWIGGIGNHKDAFISVYADLLGLFSLTQYRIDGYSSAEQLSDADKLYLSEFSEVAGIIGPFLRNPLISNLYYLVTQSHEKMLGPLQAPQCQQDCLVWDGFDPYFLLR